MNKAVAILVAVIILLTSSMAFAATDTGKIIGDLIILRPLGFVSAVAGTILYVITWPTSAIAGSTDITYKALVKHPFEYTFKRPVGEIESGLEEY